MSKKIVIVGGGYAGVEAALTLSKHTKKADLEITLIDRNDYHTLLTELHEVAGNRIGEDGIIIPFDRIFKYTDVRVVMDTIVEYDFETKRVMSADRVYEYDYLILAMGSKPNDYGVQGVGENAFTLWSYRDALKIREHVTDCFRRARQEEDEAVRRKLLTFTVAGAGFTGVEMIGELAIWTRKLAREYGADPSEVRLIIADLLPRILNVMSEKNSRKVHDYLVRKLNVEVMLNKVISDVSDDGFSAGGTYIPTATLIWACGICAIDDVNQMDIEKISGRRLKVDNFCETVHDGVFAVGDISGFTGGQERPYPAMVENAIQTAHGVASNIIADLRGKPRSEVTVKMHGIMVSVGNYFAVSDIMGREFGRVLSMLMKYMVNVHYLWEITGFYGIAKYLYHEILERRQDKNIVEQHYSIRNQTWWMVPARIFLGAIWLYEGIVKIGEGWLKSPRLQSFFGGADAFYQQFLNPASADAVTNATTGTSSAADAISAATGAISSAVSSAADAVSSATGAWSGAVSSAVSGSGEHVSNTLMNWDWSWIKFIAVKANDVAFKIDFYPMTWIRDHWLLAGTGSQMFFQWFVVLAEILIGLCLIGGAFNFVASGMSIVLLVSFLMTTGLYMQSQWWMLFVSFAVLAGAGRAFGLDHYLIPYLNNYWERIFKTRKWCPFFRRALDRYYK